MKKQFLQFKKNHEISLKNIAFQNVSPCPCDLLDYYTMVSCAAPSLQGGGEKFRTPTRESTRSDKVCGKLVVCPYSCWGKNWENFISAKINSNSSHRKARKGVFFQQVRQVSLSLWFCVLWDISMWVIFSVNIDRNFVRLSSVGRCWTFFGCWLTRNLRMWARKSFFFFFCGRNFETVLIAVKAEFLLLIE